VHAQAGACGYQKFPYDCDVVLKSHLFFSRQKTIKISIIKHV
jgi:hypothetical protein